MLAGTVLGSASTRRANVEVGKVTMGEPTPTMGQRIAEPGPPAPPPPELVMGAVAPDQPPK